MQNSWESLIDEGSEDSKYVLEQFRPNPMHVNGNSNQENELELYLKLSREGRSVLRNLKDRKEFYRPDIYEHLVQGTLYKEFPTLKGKTFIDLFGILTIIILS